jgi:hypothetical protein
MPQWEVDQAATSNSSAMKVAWARMSRPQILPHHCYHLVACQCSSRRPEAAELQSDQAFYVAVALFDSPIANDKSGPVRWSSPTIAEDDATLEEHLAQVAQGQAVAQVPEHHERDAIGRVLGPVQQAGASLVELLAAIPAAEPMIAWAVHSGRSVTAAEPQHTQSIQGP